jgi:hypothetical protein
MIGAAALRLLRARTAPRAPSTTVKRAAAPSGTSVRWCRCDGRGGLGLGRRASSSSNCRSRSASRGSCPVASAAIAPRRAVGLGRSRTRLWIERGRVSTWRRGWRDVRTGSLGATVDRSERGTWMRATSRLLWGAATTVNDPPTSSERAGRGAATAGVDGCSAGCGSAVVVGVSDGGSATDAGAAATAGAGAGAAVPPASLGSGCGGAGAGSGCCGSAGRDGRNESGSR